MSKSTELILGIVSVAMFVGMVIAVPIVVSRLPADYFVRPERKHSLPKKIGRNVLGALLIAAGIAMLVLPGQGIITILFGLSIVDLPVKRRLFRWLLQHPTVEKGVRLFREKAGQPPFIVPAHAHAHA